MHARRVVPDEERLAVLLGLVHEVARSLDQHLVEGGHVVFRLQEREVVHVGHVGHVRKRRQRAFIHDLLLADLAPARLHGGVVRVRRPAMDQAARAILVVVFLVHRERIPVRVRHRVEVVQVAEELVEAVQRRQELVQVAEVVLAELAGGVALRLERGGNRAGLGRHADVGAGLADGRQPGADREFAGDEVRPTRRATGLGVVVGEPHAFGGEFVEVRRLAGHDALVVGADVEPAHVIAHDEEDVGLLVRCLRRSSRAKKRRRGYKQRQAAGN